MDQHPIPQDVTGFQFKLIGTMTVKQFGFVASGVILAVIIFYLPIAGPLAPLVKVILVPLFGASGVVIAFVPIEGRPVDVMTSNFVKALFSPNQYIYHRQGRKLSFSAITDAKITTVKKVDPKAPIVNTASVARKEVADKEAKLREFLNTSHGGAAKSALDQKEAAFLKTLALPTVTPTVSTLPKATPVAVTRPATVKPVVAQTPAAAPIKTAAPVQQAPIKAAAPLPPQPAPVTAAPQKETNETLEKKETMLEQELAQAKQEEAQVAPAAQPAAHQKVTTLSTQIEQIHAQKQQLEQELAKLKTQLSEQKQPAPTAVTPQATPAPVAAAPAPIPAPAKPAIPIQDPNLVRIVPKTATAKGADLPRVSDTPNVVVGIVKDPRGNILSNMLVEVKDKEGNPVRAFKTNALGQFASATPLSPGIYTMELDDPKKHHTFDVIQITANNQIMLPIEIISHDAREELRKQLFN